MCLPNTLNTRHYKDRHSAQAGYVCVFALQVCNSYKYMPNDKAMLQYGFLQVRQYSRTAMCHMQYGCSQPGLGFGL